MDDESRQRIAELGDLRAESARLRERAPNPSDRLEVIAERAWAAPTNWDPQHGRHHEIAGREAVAIEVGLVAERF
jgi:hypothetical protein